MRTSLDDAIPFLPWTIFGYAWCYTSTLLPVFVVRSWELFRRGILAYVMALLIAFACFAFFPVTSRGFRPDLSTLDPNHFVTWAARTNLSIDPPFNLFPSLHMALAALAAYITWKARRLFGLISMGIAVAIAITICTIKAHFIADGLAGLELAAVVSVVCVRPFRSQSVPLADRAYSWRALVAYFTFHFAFYFGFFVAFLVQ